MVALETGTVDVLVVPFVDRFCRGYAEPARAEKAMNTSGGDIIDSTGRSARNDDSWSVLVGVAISESKRISRRVKTQQQQAADKGRPHGGGRPFGWEPGGAVVRESEADVIREATGRLLSGEPMGAVVRDLREREIKGPKGALLTTTMLRQIICNPRVAGIRVHNGQEVGKAAWEPIISESDYRRVRSIFTGRARGGRGVKGPREAGASRIRKYAYSGLIRCAQCESRGPASGKMYGSSGAYVCACRKTYLKAAPVERILDERVLKTLTADWFLKAVQQRIEAALQGADPRALDQDRAELDDYRKLPARFRTSETEQHMRELEKSVTDAERRLAALPEVQGLAGIVKLGDGIKDAWPSLPIELKRIAIRATLDIVLVKPAAGRRDVAGRLDIFDTQERLEQAIPLVADIER
jgi:hypothetical protein